MKKNSKKWMPLFMAGILMTGCIISPATADAKKRKVDLNGTYHAALGISTAMDDGINRDAYYSKSVNESYKTDQWDKLMSEDSVTKQPVEHEGNFTDVVIKGNGTYTVKLQKADFAGERTIYKLHVATDIPVNNKITFSNVSAKINGQTIVTFEEPYMEEEKQYLSGGMDILLLNPEHDELVQQLAGRGITKSSTNDYDLLKETGNNTIKVTFTVDGFRDEEEKQTEEPVNTPKASETLPPTESDTPGPSSEENVSDMTQDTLTKYTPTASAPIIAVVVSSVAFCGVVIIIVNNRRKRK